MAESIWWPRTYIGNINWNDKTKQYGDEEMWDEKWNEEDPKIKAAQNGLKHILVFEVLKFDEILWNQTFLKWPQPTNQAWLLTQDTSACDIAVIEKNGVTPKWVETPF